MPPRGPLEPHQRTGSLNRSRQQRRLRPLDGVPTSQPIWSKSRYPPPGAGLAVHRLDGSVLDRQDLAPIARAGFYRAPGEPSVGMKYVLVSSKSTGGNPCEFDSRLGHFILQPSSVLRLVLAVPAQVGARRDQRVRRARGRACRPVHVSPRTSRPLQLRPRSWRSRQSSGMTAAPRCQGARRVWLGNTA